MAYGPSKKDHDRHIDLLGFAPDLDMDIPGACSVMDGVMPSTRGWRAIPSLDRSIERYGFTPGPVTPVTQLHRGVAFTYARVGSQIIGLSPTGYGSAQTLTGAAIIQTTAPVPFVRFGNYVVMGASNGIYTSTNTGVGIFSLIPGTEAISTFVGLVSANRFVVAFGSQGQWRCSARDDHQSWALSPATLASSGILPPSGGYAIRAVCAFGDDILVAHTDRMYIGRFVPGDAEVWKWELLPIRVGALAGNSMVPYKNGVAFMSDDGFFLYDGANLTNLMEDRLLHWFRNRAAANYETAVVVDEASDLIWIMVKTYTADSMAYITGDTPGTFTKRLFVVDVKTKRWGLWNGEAISAIGSDQYWRGNAYPHYEPRDAKRTLWLAPATGDFKPRELGLAATAASVANITVNDFGDAFIDTELTRASLKFISRDQAAVVPSVAHATRNNLDATLTAISTIARAPDGLFDVRQNARWHRLTFTIPGDFEVAGFAVETTPVGLR